MPGIYLHIPFCKKACHYCNFHFSTTARYQDQMVEAMVRELEEQQNYLADKKLDSIYFGGGTPSMLNEQQLGKLFDQIQRLFTVREKAEITLEANPDDLHADKIRELSRSPVNRLSIGIQSFFDEDLIFMNRAHNATEAKSCIPRAQDAGFENLTIDLIYGTPAMGMDRWKQNLDQFLSLDIPHLSSYCLTVEPGTALHHFVQTGKMPAVDEEAASRQFEFLMDRMEASGYGQYEISNFARPGREAIHNSNYWKGVPYLGIGPSAHSYDGQSRQWNVANNARYMATLEKGEVPFEREVLTPDQRYNEYVMTALRTSWGIDLPQIPTAFQSHFLEKIAAPIEKGWVFRKGDIFRLTRTGKLMADFIAAECFL